MTTEPRHSEAAFEILFEPHLLQNGYVAPEDSDGERAICPDVLAFSREMRLYPEEFFEVYLPVPPLEEQRAIVAYIAAETDKLDAMRAATERTIALLRERRAALIAAASRVKLMSGAGGTTLTTRLGARLSYGSRAPSNRASRGTICEFQPFFGGGAAYWERVHISRTRS